MKTPVLILGARGQLGREFCATLSRQGVDFEGVGRLEGDITSPEALDRLFARVRPKTVINCAAYNLVDQAEDEPDRAYAVNALAPAALAQRCAAGKAVLVHYSTDYVFDGAKQSPYNEEDEPRPLNVYGKSKLAGEHAIREQWEEHLIFRVSWVIGRGKQNFLYKLREWAGQRQELKISSDEVSVPSFTRDIVDVTLMALDRSLKGLYHLTNTGVASRYALAETFIRLKGLTNTLVPVPMSTFVTKARRPAYSAMSNHKISTALGITIAPWQERIKDYV